MAIAPGVPGDLFGFVADVPGLLDELEDDPTIEEFNLRVRSAADDGLLPEIVADHIEQWNLLKAADDCLYVRHYADYTASRAGDWGNEGLPVPDDESGGTSLDGGPAASAKVPRNAPCPCGSGRKSKHCHGRG